MASGCKTKSLGICKALTVEMQKHCFTVNFHVIPLNNYDAVMGAKWLQEVGLVWWDFKERLLTFKHQGKEVILQGLHTTGTAYISNGKAQQLLRKHKLALLILQGSADRRCRPSWDRPLPSRPSPSLHNTRMSHARAALLMSILSPAALLHHRRPVDPGTFSPHRAPPPRWAKAPIGHPYLTHG